MKYLLYFLFPILLFSCKKEEMHIPVSEGTRLIKMEAFDSDQSLDDIPNHTRKYYYNDQGNLKEEHWFNRHSSEVKSIRKYFYTEMGLLESKTIGSMIEGSYLISNYYTFSYSADGDLLEKYSWFSSRDNGVTHSFRHENLLLYNSNGEITLDSFLIPTNDVDNYIENQFINHYHYHWEDGNVVKVDHYNLKNEKVAVEIYEYDQMQNFQKSLPYLSFPSNFHIPKGRNNIIQYSYNDLSGYGPITICRPCTFDYKYNSYGFPYYSQDNTGSKVIYTYEGSE